MESNDKVASGMVVISRCPESNDTESWKDPQEGATGDAQFVQANPERTWKSYLWDTLDKSPQERRFLLKLDVVLLTLACLGNMIMFMDQLNINNAFVSGMEKDLNLYGNQLTYLQVWYNVGYVVGQIPR